MLAALLAAAAVVAAVLFAPGIAGLLAGAAYLTTVRF